MFKNLGQTQLSLLWKLLLNHLDICRQKMHYMSQQYSRASLLPITAVTHLTKHTHSYYWEHGLQKEVWLITQ